MRTGLLLTLAMLLPAHPAAAAAEPAGQAALIEIHDAIGPATSGHFGKAHAKAIEAGVRIVVLHLDTPGGLDSAMRDIIKVILSSPVPVACFVAPGGARAASAGTYILYACHVAAMAPATNLGAATPIPVGGSAPLPGMPDKPEGKDPQGKDDKDGKDRGEGPKAPQDAGQTKVVNDAVAYIRSLAEMRGRNADWAERAVREGASLSAERAVEQGVVDLLANDVDDLLRKIDGRKVTTTTGEITLATAGLPVQAYAPDWRMKFLAIITNPTVAYVMLMIGIYGLLLEGYHPGSIVPGVTGAICLLLALYAFQMLPVNYVGLALILLGIVLMIAEALAPSFGALGVGGLVAFVFGSVMLMDIDVPGYGVNLGLIFGIASAGGLILGLMLYLLWRSRGAPVVTGDQTLLGHTVEIAEPIEREGWGWVAGERWRVRSAVPLQPGDRPKITSMDGLTLIVTPERKGE